MTQSEDVLTFWFGSTDGTVDDAQKKKWFIRDDDFDAQIRKRFGEDVERAIRGAFDAWTDTPRDRIALILMLDQFSRNLFRGSPRAWSQDLLAQKLALDGIERGHDKELYPVERVFFYLPLEHAEDLHLQEMSVEKFQDLADSVDEGDDYFAGVLDYAIRHHEIIERFGRFPHRNEVLSRPSTPEELEFLEQPNSSF